MSDLDEKSAFRELSAFSKERYAHLCKANGISRIYADDKEQRKIVNGRKVDSLIRVIPKRLSLYTQLWFVRSEEEKCPLVDFVYDCAEVTTDKRKACFVVENWTYFIDLLDMNVCACCGRLNNVPGHKFLSCSKCKMVHFCSKACLETNWPSHKNFCIGWKGQRVLPSSSCWMGPTAGKIKFANSDEASEFFAQKRKAVKTWTRLSQMKRATNDLLLDLFTSPSQYMQQELSIAKFVDPNHPALFAQASQAEHSLLQVQLLNANQDAFGNDMGAEHSPLKVVMTKNGLSGTVFVFLRTMAGPFQIIVCKRSTLLDGAKKNREWNKAKANEKQKKHESAEHYNLRRNKMCDNVMYWHELVKRLDNQVNEDGLEPVMFAFATKKFPLMFFNLNADRLMPYGMFHYAGKLSRYDLRVPRPGDWQVMLDEMRVLKGSMEAECSRHPDELVESPEAGARVDSAHEEHDKKEQASANHGEKKVFVFKASRNGDSVLKRKTKPKRGLPAKFKPALKPIDEFCE